MNTPCILVTGVGAIIGQGIIKSLRMENRPVRIIGIDRNPDAFGAHHCDVFHTKPENENGTGYLSFLEGIIEKHGIDLILPGIEHDVFYFQTHRHYFKKLRALPVLNNYELIEIARDKWKTARSLIETGIQVIPGIISDSWQQCVSELGPPPLLMKPRHGNGSRGIQQLNNEQDFEYWKNNTSDTFMIQRIVGTDDQEYTASIFGFGDGDSTIPIIFKRKLSQDGSTLSAKVVQDQSISDFINRLNTHFKPIGPTNYQFRKESEFTYLLEVNPRISSATSFRAAFDFNESWMCIDYFINGIRPNPEPKQAGMAVRYTEDWIEYK